MSPLALITGACGFMGTHMVEVLHEAGFKIRATDLPNAYEKDDLKTGRFPSVLKKYNVEFFPADLTKPETLNGLVDGVDYVFHIAAVFSYSAPLEVLMKVNVDGTKNLLTLLKNSPTFKKIVLWAAGGVYQFPRGPQDLPITESTPIDPQNNYLKSKWAQECLVRDFCKEHQMSFSAIRPTTVYGPRAVYGGGQMILDPLKMKKIMVPRNFNFRIPTIHVRDVCRSALFLAQHPETDGEAYNINDNSRTTTVEFMEMMAKYTGKKFSKILPIPLSFLRGALSLAATLGKQRRKFFGGPPPKFENDMVKYFGIDFVCGNEKIKQTGFQFEYPEFAGGLKATLPWYQETFKL